ncbi:MAG: alcohol dehydrogenase catalytic domain-containing protein [Actinomycetota bacterium]
MRAWVLDEAEGSTVPRLGAIDDPSIGPWDVRVTLRASALNHVDLWVARGMPAPPSFPHVPGADGAGVVIETGQAVDDLRIGTEVVIDPSVSCGRCTECLHGKVLFCPDFQVLGEHRWGTHAEQVVLPRTNVVPKPPSLAWEEAGSFGLVLASAVRMLRRARLAPGERVLVVGVGGGSASAAFLAAIAGGADVYASSRHEDTQLWAMAQGAAGVFEPGDVDSVREATGGRGVDVVIDNVGTATFGDSLEMLARGGRLVTNGSTSGRTAELHLPTVFWRQLEVIGSSMNDHDEFVEAVRLVEDGLRVPIAASFGFEDYPAALEQLGPGGGVGKIVLRR